MEVIIFVFLSNFVDLIIIANIQIKLNFKTEFSNFRELVTGFSNIKGVQLA